MTNEKRTNLLKASFDLFTFVLLIMVYGIYQIIGRASRKMRHSNTEYPMTKLYHRIVQSLDQERAGSISRVNLIELSLRNMANKKTRTWITMGGMAIGIGMIVLLVSIGYGLEQLVIRRVARLEELKQADVIPGLSQELVLTDKSVADFKQISGLTDAIPVISAVGRVNYNNSETDMAVYGVTSKYLVESAIHPIEGKIFESNELSTETSTAIDTQNAVVNIEEAHDKNITFTLEDNAWYRVRDQADVSGKIIGFTRRIDQSQDGTEIKGGEYEYQSSKNSKWIRSSVPLWEKKDCAEQESCEDGQYLPLLNDGAQVNKEGYIAEINVIIKYKEPSESGNSSEPVVLGESTDGSLPIVEIATLSGKLKNDNVQTLAVGGRSVKEMVVNSSALKILGLDASKAVGSVIKISFIIVGSGNEKSTVKTESLETDYKIVGVIAEESTPILYVPFIDLRSLGVESYSQIKIITDSKDSLSHVRTTIESMGYGTISVTDTIGQIDKLFTTLRRFLAALGIVALSVAALGMFNTLTVSLLERTHEVGLMKAIGMKSSEVKELFMTESMIMGFFGGILGLILGILAGLVVSLLLSILALTKGVGFINITYIPFPFALLIIFISLLVGIGTGYIPARRATRISALDALRYE